MKDVLRYIKSLSSDPSDALKKKIFALTTTRSNATRKKRGEKEACFICFATIQFYISVFRSSCVSNSKSNTDHGNSSVTFYLNLCHSLVFSLN